MADGTMMTPMAPEGERPPGVPLNAENVGGKWYMYDPKGGLVPLDVIKPTHLLEDEAVRKILAFALDLNAQITRFKEHTLGDVSALLAVFDQEHGASRGGTKGNVTLTTFDGTMKVQLAIADLITFGPELQSAKKLVDECLNEWSADSRPELQAIVQRAFNTDKEGLVNRAELFGLLRLDIKDDRWQRAMQAIRDSIRIDGTKEYVRFYTRADARQAWSPVRIDVAAA